MRYEYRVVSQAFGTPKEVEAELNSQASEDFEHYQTITLGPIPTRWLCFRRPIKEA